jgi:hypothetical protein
VLARHQAEEGSQAGRLEPLPVAEPDRTRERGQGRHAAQTAETPDQLSVRGRRTFTNVCSPDTLSE